MRPLDADETALRDYAERHCHPGRSLDDVTAEWARAWEAENGEPPDEQRTGHFRWHVLACRRVLEQLDTRVH
jgi:hypothetical protein